MIPLSKTRERALGCEVYFSVKYLAPNTPERADELTQTGVDFHRYRENYVERLRNTKRNSDRAWVEKWLSTAGISEEAQALILEDVEYFTVNPEEVWCTELYLAVDEFFEPWLGGARPPFLHGYIDLLEIIETEPPSVRIREYKTGFNTEVRDFEGVAYAVLAFARFKWLERVTVRWEFVRVRGVKEVSYTRDNLLRLWARVRSAHARMMNVIERHKSGQALTVNPMAGLCAWCDATCPLRPNLTAGVTELAPPQTEEDARKLAEMLHVAEVTASTARRLLRGYLDRHGRVTLSEGKEVVLAPRLTGKFPLRSTLAALGVEVPAVSEKFDVPLDSLFVGTSELRRFASTRARVGMSEALDQVAKWLPTSEVQIRDAQEGEDV